MTEAEKLIKEITNSLSGLNAGASAQIIPTAVTATESGECEWCDEFYTAGTKTIEGPDGEIFCSRDCFNDHTRANPY